MRCPVVEAQLTLLPEVSRPRNTLYRGYRPHIVIGPPTQRIAARDGNMLSELHQSVVFLDEYLVIAPGQTVLVRLALWAYPEHAYADVVPGATFTLREGPQIVGFGTILTRQDADQEEH